MLDKRSLRLLSILLRICVGGSYKIIEVNELLKAMAPRFHLDISTLEQAVEYLSANELIDVKYHDEKVFCISVLPKGRVAVENGRRFTKTENKVTVIKHLRWLLLFAVCFTASFLGALLARWLG